MAYQPFRLFKVPIYIFLCNCFFSILHSVVVFCFRFLFSFCCFFIYLFIFTKSCRLLTVPPYTKKCLNTFIRPINGTITGISTPCQSGPGSDSNAAFRLIIRRTFVLYLEHPFRLGLTSLKGIQSVFFLRAAERVTIKRILNWLVKTLFFFFSLALFCLG